jgi:hypothetical protein
VKEPRNYQELRAEHSRAATEPDQNENAKASDGAYPTEPTRPSQQRAASTGSTDMDRLVHQGADVTRRNEAASQAYADTNSKAEAADRDAIPSHKLDKERGKAALEADLREALGNTNESEDTPERRNAAQDTPTHKLDKESGKAVLEDDLKEARESNDHAKEGGRDTGRDR